MRTTRTGSTGAHLGRPGYSCRNVHRARVGDLRKLLLGGAEEALDSGDELLGLLDCLLCP